MAGEPFGFNGNRLAYFVEKLAHEFVGRNSAFIFAEGEEGDEGDDG